MITKKEVKHIAKLARLGLTNTEIKKFRGDLSKILDYIEKLKEVDVSKIESTSYLIPTKNVMRKDEAGEENLERRKKIIEMAPEKKEGYLKVKSVLK